jgi:hypothetical protein
MQTATAELNVELACLEVRGQIYGVDVQQVREIVRSQTLTPLPRAPELVEGVIDLRGVIVPVVDLGRALGGTGRPLCRRPHRDRRVDRLPSGCGPTRPPTSWPWREATFSRRLRSSRRPGPTIRAVVRRRDFRRAGARPRVRARKRIPIGLQTAREAASGV